jgi:di/tricarboxylate transporter
VLGAIAIVTLFGDRLLPHRTPQAMPADLSQHARTLVEQYDLDGATFQLRVRPGSAFIGSDPGAIDLAAYPGVTMVSTQSGADGGRLQGPVMAGDMLLVRGDAVTTGAMAADLGLAFRQDGAPEGIADALLGRTAGVAEIIIPPRSTLVGSTAFPGMVTPSGDLVILAVQRRGEDQGPAPTTLAVGDTLLLQGTWKALDEHLADPEVMVVDDPRLVRRQAVPLGAGAWAAIAILVAMVAMLATGVVPSVVAGLMAAGAMILLRVVTMQGAYRAISWTTIVLVGAMIPLSTAMIQTGAADQLAGALVDLVGDAGPYALLAGLFLLTATLGQLISNMATALIIIPIAVAAAIELQISPTPVLMSVTVAAAASFLTPVATPVNMMVMGPAGYRFADYWKLGIVFMLMFFVVSVVLVPVFWAF